MVLRNMEHHEGVIVGDNNINNLRYADNIILIADYEENHQNQKWKQKTSTECKEDWEHGFLKTVRNSCM